MTTDTNQTQSARAGDGNLPPLPAPAFPGSLVPRAVACSTFTADQMRDYARDALAAAPAVSAPAAVPMCSEQAVLHALTMARSETHQQGDAALWQAFGRAMWRQFNAMLGAPAWQPIDGAPQDGRTLLLGYPNRAGKWRTVRGQWMSQAYIDEYWEDPDSGEPGWYETAEEAEDIPNCWAIRPTHYMLLPAAPEIPSPATGDAQ